MIAVDLEIQEQRRLAALGLVEVAVVGTHAKLLEPAVKGKALSAEQRTEMARRHNAVAHLLPRYVKQFQPKVAQPEGHKAMPSSKAENPAQGAEQQAAPTQPEDKQQKEETVVVTRPAKRKARKLPNVVPSSDYLSKAAKKRLADEEAAKAKAAAKAAAAKGGKPAKQAKPEKAAKAAKKEAAPKKAGGIGNLICEQLVAKKSTEEILKAVKVKFPASRTSPASIAWYRSRLREEGKLPKA